MAKRRRRVPPKSAGQQPASAAAAVSSKGTAPSSPGAAKRILAALVFMFVVGVGAGVGVSFVMPAGLFPADRAAAELEKDTGTALERAAAVADDGDPDLFAASALANTLLLVDHAGGSAEKKRADALLKTTLAWVRVDTKALFARVLLRRVGVDDAALDDDLEKRADERQKDPWWLLAKSARAYDLGKRDDAFAFAQRAAFGERAPLRAQVELARQALAAGDVADARAYAERITRREPEHAQGIVLGIVAAVVDDVKNGESPEERAIKLKRIKQRHGPRKEGPPPRPGDVDRKERDAELEASLALWHGDEEDAAIANLDKLDDRDVGVVAFVLEALAATRGDDALAAEMKKRVAPVAAPYATLAARQVELQLLVGDTAGADELLSAALEKNPGNVELLLDQARLKALAVLGDDELHRRASGKQHNIGVDALDLPFGKLVFDPFGIGGIPMKAELDSSVFPEAAFATALRSGNIAKKLDVLVLVHKADAALVRGDIPAAAAAAQQAKSAAGSDPDVLFLDARIKLRQADRAGAKDAIDAALASSPEDPHVLLQAARLHYDNEGYIPARKALGKLRALGLKSPAALALEAMLAARSNDDKAAQQALAEAESIGAGDVEILRAKVLVLRDGKDLEAVRKAADKLFAVDELRTTDPILRAWEADAAARQGDTLRAQAVLDEVLASRATLADAWLLKGSIEAGTDVKAATASFDKAIELAPGSEIAGEAKRRKAVLKGVKGAGPPPTQQKSKLLPRKKPR